MGHIVIRHLSGSKANQENRFPLDGFEEITLGRHPSSSVMFSDETEVIVGRRHARITRNPALTSLFFITDLGSRNGTFVNNQRIFGAVTLNPGDLVQCGIGGPEFRFDVESEPDRLYTEAPPRPPDNPLEQVGAADVEAPNVPAKAPARNRSPAVGGVLIGLIAIGAGYVGYRSLRSNNSSEAVKTILTPEKNASPEASPGKYDHAHLSGAAAEAEKDAQRAAWRIEVAPYRTLGSGRPGAEASDFDGPAGLAFSPNGLLFAIDAGNRRIQIWDVKNGSRLTEFGRDVFGGAITGIAIAPDNQILVTDRARGLAYAFTSPALVTGQPPGPDDYQFKDVRFGDQGFTNLSGVAIDSKGRAYVVDANAADVLRFDLDGAPDKTWNFEKARVGGDAYLHGCDGIAIDEAGGDLLVASEKDAVVEVFDWESGAYKNRTVGAGKDASGKLSGKRVFFGSIRGMTVAQRRLLAVDESAGHIQVFDLALPNAFNTDLDGYAAPRSIRSDGYQGFFAGHFCSPSSIASHTDRASGETYIAVADQCNHRIVVYRWSDIAKALGIAETTAGATLAANKAGVEKKTPAVATTAPTAIKKNSAPGRRRLTSSNRAGKVTNAGNIKSASKATSAGNVTTAGKATGAATGLAGASSGKNKQSADNYSDSSISGKKAKKAKKAKKVKY
ncbi:MAG TPA: FHA domain-containing protein [Blastocatellia bacterium]|nr:FHA domain-containing protein [Blastocatellia bacterium]